MALTAEQREARDNAERAIEAMRANGGVARGGPWGSLTYYAAAGNVRIHVNTLKTLTRRRIVRFRRGTDGVLWELANDR